MPRSAAPTQSVRPLRTALDPVTACAARLKRLRAAMAKLDIDALLVTSPIDVGYLTGFLGGDSFVLVPSGTTKPTIISDGRYDEELQPQRAMARVVIRSAGMNETVAQLVEPASRLGIQSDRVTLAEQSAMAAAMPRVTLVPVGGLVQELRLIKDELEIELMRKAIRIQEAALDAVLPDLAKGKLVGKSELHLAAALEAEMKSRGSSKAWFESIIGCGAGAALPHYRPGSAKIKKNTGILIDWGATWQGYAGDMTRCFAIGRWPAKIREIYEIVLEAQQAAAAAIKPGKTTHEIDAVARNIITKAGYGKEFNHGLGHGLGMSKESPYLNPLYPVMELKVGHVCTVEPGIYLPGVGGVRIEDQYVVRERGAENLCRMPKDLEWATL